MFVKVYESMIEFNSFDEAFDDWKARKLAYIEENTPKRGRGRPKKAIADRKSVNVSVPVVFLERHAKFVEELRQEADRGIVTDDPSLLSPEELRKKLALDFERENPVPWAKDF